RLFSQEADEQNQDRRRGPTNRRTVGTDLMRQRNSVRAVLVPGRGALRAAVIDGRRTQRYRRHSGQIYARRHSRGNPAKDAARQSTITVFRGVAMKFVLLLLFGALSAQAETVVRIGHFPNITHAQGVIAHANGWFEKKLGPDVKVQWYVYNAGPS